MSPDQFDRPQHFRSLPLKLPQKAHGKADVTDRQLRLVLAHHIKELVLNSAGPELTHDLVLTHSAMMEEQSVRVTAQGVEPEHNCRSGTGQESSLHSSALCF